MSGSHMWAALIGAMLMSLFFVVVLPAWTERRPERRWSRAKRRQRREIDRLARKGTP